MTPQQVYNKVLLKINKNDSNANVKLSKRQFVLIFNEEKRKYLNSILAQHENTDIIEQFESLLITDKSLVKINEEKLKANFKLPTNFLKRTTGYCLTTREDCKDVALFVWFVKPKDITTLLQNQNLNPSFDYQETIAIINSGQVSVYRNDFTVNELFLSYYKEPVDIDIAGYTNYDGTPSQNVTVDAPDDIIESIIDRTVTETVRNFESPEQLQIALQRETKE